MRFSFKKGLYCSLIILSSIATARFCHHQTKGFAVSKILHNLIDESTSAQLSNEQIQWARHLFAYPFRYLGRGHQSFVFLSEDGSHVLKLFNNCHQRKMAFFRLLSALPLIRGWANRHLLAHQEKLEKNFKSYQLAFTQMQDKTALLFIHLKATHNLPAVTLIDPLHIKHRLDLNSLGFLIQKKAKLVYPRLEELIQIGDKQAAKRALSKLLDLLIWKCQQGIGDNDPLIRTNFGFIEEEAIQIDVGPLSYDTTIQNPQKMRQEIIRITTSLKNWLAEKSPDLLLFLEQQLQERLS